MQKVLKGQVTTAFSQEIAQVLSQAEYKGLQENREAIRYAIEKRLNQVDDPNGFRFHEFYDEIRAIALLVIKNPNDPDAINIIKRKKTNVSIDLD